MSPDELAAHVVLVVKSAISPVVERLAAAEARLAALGDVRDRVVTLETKAAAPLMPPPPLPLPDLELRDRVASLEARAPLPGPPGPAGPAGKDGHDGANGVDGLGFDDLGVELRDRTLSLTFQRGARVRTFPVQLPFLKYHGVYQAGKAYETGDTVTWAGQLWHCHDATSSAPGDGSKQWQLCVRKGRDGKDGRNADVPLIVTTTGTSTGAR